MMEYEKKLSKKQKAVLCQLAARAFVASGAAGWYANVGEYRHAVAAEECGITGLSEATQQHYVPLYNAFARAAGVREIADRTPKTQLEREVYLLREEMQRFELTEGYVLPIMLDRLGLKMPMPFDSLCLQLGAEGVRQVKFTVRKRGLQHKRELEARLELPPATIPHASAATLPPERLAEYLGEELVEPLAAPRRSRKGDLSHA